MTKKYHLAFDIDDTLCSLVGPVIELARTVLGRTLKIPTYGQYVGWFPGQMSDAERQALLKHVHTPEFYLGLPSNFSAHSGTSVARVSDAAYDCYESVSVITARSIVLGDKAEAVTREWLRLHDFYGWEDVPIFVHDHSTKKPSFCNVPTVAVEDNVSVADDFLADDRHKVILVDQIWNQGHPRHKAMMRVPSRRLCEALSVMSQ